MTEPARYFFTTQAVMARTPSTSSTVKVISTISVTRPAAKGGGDGGEGVWALAEDGMASNTSENKLE